MKILSFCLLLPLFLAAQTQEYKVLKDQTAMRTLQLDQLHLDASLQFDTVQYAVQGHVTITAISLVDKLDSIWLDAVNMEILEVYLKNAKEFKQEITTKGIRLSQLKGIKKGDTLEVKILYKATPQRGLFFVGWDDKTNTAPRQIWSQGQGIDNRHWLPHVDDQRDKLTTHLEIDFASNYQVISNGKRTKKTVLENGLTRWVYDMHKPHSSYLIMLGIGKYAWFKQRSANGTEIENYYYPQWENRNQFTYYKNKEIFNFLQDEIPMPYPWPNYKQVPVMNFQHGAMENTSATIFGDFYCTDSIGFNDLNYVGVNAHELAHQWFGNLVTSLNSKHHWLHEGFASYYAWLAQKEVFGEEYFAILRKKSLDNVAQAEAQDMFPLAHGQAGSWRFYDKGAWVLHMLRNKVGEQAWDTGLKSYLTQFAFKTVETQDFQLEMEKASGLDLSPFFNQWVYQPQIPKLNLDVEYDGEMVRLKVEQDLLENQPPYQINVPIMLLTTNRKIALSLNMKNQKGSSTFQMPKGEKLVAVLPDKDFDLLAEWTVTGYYGAIENMAVNADFPWYGAVKSLVKNEKYDPKIAKKMADAHVLNRIEYAAFLGFKGGEDNKLADEELEFLAAEKNMEVIKSFLFASGSLPKGVLEMAEKWLMLPSYDIKEKALTLLVLSDQKNAMQYLIKLDHVYGTKGNNVRMTWLVLNQIYGAKNSESELVEFMSPQHEFITRMNALSMVGVLDLVSYKTADYAFSALLQNNRKLRNAAKIYIVKMSENKDGKADFQRWVNREKYRLSEAQLTRIKNMTGYAPE